jgi:hypothetical protein
MPQIPGSNAKEDRRCAKVKNHLKSTPTEQEEATDEVHAVRAAHGARDP